MPKPKAIKKVFEPDRYEVEFGEKVLVVEPQPMDAVIAFYEAVENEIGSFDAAMDVDWYVDIGGEHVAGPFETEEEAEEIANKHEGGVVTSDVSFKTVIEKLLATPYKPLVVVIPGLEEEDLRHMTFPHLMFVLDLVIEVNGLKFFKSFVKKTWGDLGPKIISTWISSIVADLNSSTVTQMATNGDQT